MRIFFLVTFLMTLSSCEDDENMKHLLFYYYFRGAGQSSIPLAGTPAGLYSTYLLNTSYEGNCIRVRRSSDNSEQDFGFSGTTLYSKMSKTDIDTFLGGSNGSISTIYDQSGNGYDLAVEATYTRAVLYYDDYLTNYVIRFGNAGGRVSYTIPSGLTIATQNVSLYTVIRGRKSQTGIEAYFDWGTNNFMYYQNDFNSRSVYDGAADINPDKYIANSTDFNVHSVRSNGSGVFFNIDGLFTTSSGTVTSASPAGGRIGRWTGATTFDIVSDAVAFIVYQSALSTDDNTTNISSLLAMTGKTVNHSKLVVCVGDSMTEGINSLADDKNYPILLKREFAQTVKFINSGYSGNTLVQMNTDRLIRAVNSIAQGTYTNKVAIVWGGTNDILGGADAATTYTRAETLCDNLRAGGFDKIIFVNCLPRTDFTAGQETIRGEFNTLLAADHSFADVLVDAASGDFTGEFIDGVHLNATGNQHLVDSFMTTALTSVL